MVNTSDRDRFYLNEFIAPIMPVGMTLAAVYLMSLWAVSAATGTPDGRLLTAVELGGGAVLVLLAGACRTLARRDALLPTALVSIAWGIVFATGLSYRAAVNGEGLLTVVPACTMIVVIGSIFSERLWYVLAAFVGILTPPVVLAQRLDPSVSNEGRYLPHVLAFTLLAIVPLYLLARMIKARYYVALTEQQQLATTDSLTGLLNRSAWCERAAAILARDHARPAPVAVLYLDVDHFKCVNDRIGHARGDEVLQRVADLLRREFDHRALISRYGGEEFVVLLEQEVPDAAPRRAERLRRAVEAFAFPEVTVTLSVGIALREQGEALAPLLHRADLALLRAKALGRNRVEVAPRAGEPSTRLAEPPAARLVDHPGRPVPLPAALTVPGP